MSTNRIDRQTITYQKLSNNRFYSLVQSAITIPSEMGMNKAHPCYLGLVKINGKIVDMSKVMSREIEYSQRKTYDKERDADYTYLVSMLNAFAKSRVEEMRVAAIALLSVFKSFDYNLDELPMDEETTELSKVLVVWGEEENQNHFETLRLKADYDKLKASSDAFEQYNISRAESSNGDGPKLISIRYEVKKLFVDWLDLLKAHANLLDDELSEKVLASINLLIREQAAYLKRKASNRETAESEE